MTLNSEIEYPDKDSRPWKPYIPSSGAHSRLGRRKGALSPAKICLKAAHPWYVYYLCILQKRPSCNDATEKEERMTGTYCGVVARCKSYGDVRYCKERDLTRDSLTFVPLYIFGTLLDSPLDLELQDSSLAISFWWFHRFSNVRKNVCEMGKIFNGCKRVLFLLQIVYQSRRGVTFNRILK